MTAIDKARRLWQGQGTAGLAQTIADRLLHRTVGIAPQAREIASGSAHALEVGGPSGVFKLNRLLPVYPYLRSLDNVNFAGATLWEKDLSDGGAFTPAGQQLGIQYLREAGCLLGLADDSYDVVLSSHTLEHLANPLPALREWRRVCRPGGHLLLVLPHRDGTFDRRRPITTLDHLLQDEAVGVDESDDTHADEILRLHDVRRDPGAGTMQVIRERVADNLSIRGMHHHVFGLDLALKAVAECGWAPVAAETRRPNSIVVIARNGPADGPLVIRRSVFSSDR